ncbi:MAG: FAD-binding oxidoreductase [Oligoflexia bacterium]|nr:FAD-binding oxidoreductase [Oligoflexia bacterium]
MMKINNLVIYSIDKLRSEILKRNGSVYCGAKTSTVISYENNLLKKLINDFKQNNRLNNSTDSIDLVDLNFMPKSMKLLNLEEKKNQEVAILQVDGPVNWEDAGLFLRSLGFDLKTSPTEELATIVAGVATSANGEHSFAFGPLRDQIIEITYMDFNGDIKILSNKNPFKLLNANESDLQSYKRYRDFYLPYANFKNAPFPRYEKETDLLIASEGQLGVIIGAKIEVKRVSELVYLAISLPLWEEDFSIHLHLFRAIQKYRGKILAAEFVDSNSIRCAIGGGGSDEYEILRGKDTLFLEVDANFLEEIYDQLFMVELNGVVSGEQIYQIKERDYKQIRVQIPRNIMETNNRMGVLKKGSDIQVPQDKMELLLENYLRGALMAKREGILYYLYGHFGDAHLHFNLTPKTEREIKICDDYFEELYDKACEWKASPFAEHGVGFIKQKFIKRFYSDVHLRIFKLLKQTHDPYNQFFPFGFMNL